MVKKPRICRISKVAREVGLSTEWLRQGGTYRVSPPPRRDLNVYSHYTLEGTERLRNRRLLGRGDSARILYRSRLDAPAEGDIDTLVAKNPFALRRFANRAEEALPELVSSEDIAKVRASAFVGEFEPAETKSYVVEESFEKDETLSWRDALSNKMSTIWEGRNKALKETVRVRAIDSLKQQRGEGGS